VDLLVVLVLSLKSVVSRLRTLSYPHTKQPITSEQYIVCRCSMLPENVRNGPLPSKEDQHKVWITVLLTPCSRVLLEKIICSQLLKKFPPFIGTWQFTTAFTSACHLPPWNLDRSIGQQESDIYMLYMVPATGLKGKFFLPMTVGVVKFANHIITCSAARTNHQKATALCADFPCSIRSHHCYSFMGFVCHGSSILLCGSNFHFCCRTAVPFICVI